MLTATGADALELGLVDQLGGLQDAIALARQEAKLSERVGEKEAVRGTGTLASRRALDKHMH